MAAQHISTAIKEEWGLTDEEVALIESSTAHSAKPGLVNRAVTGENIANILVPTSDRIDIASAIVAEWGVSAPVHGDLTSSTKHYLDVVAVMKMVTTLVDALRQMPGLVATANRMRPRAKEFIFQCLNNMHDNNYAIWDATSITEQILSIGEDGASTYKPEELVSHANTYGQLQVALSYRADPRTFCCGHSFVHRKEDELTKAIADSGSTDRINAIRILYADLLARTIQTQGDNHFKLVASNQPYPNLNE
jgi:hypothetical protein